MSQPNTNSSNRLILVGDALNADTLQLEDNDALSQLDNLSIKHYSLQDLDENLGHCKNSLTVVVSDLNTVVSSKQFELSGAFFIACNELSEANVFIPAKPSQKNLFSSIKMGFEFLPPYRPFSSIAPHFTRGRGSGARGIDHVGSEGE